MTSVCEDKALLDAWHPVAALADIEPGRTYMTRLLGEPLDYRLDRDHLDPRAEHGDRGALATMIEYGYLWVSLGEPPPVLFAIPECHERDRRTLHGGTIGVAVSAPRAVENFLDMGHFPFVHDGILGQAPHTEVLEYSVDVDPDTNDLYARNCVFYQPLAAATS